MYVQKDDITLSLKFGIVPDGVKIHPKDGYLKAQFPILPYSNAELKNQFAREVVPMTQATSLKALSASRLRCRTSPGAVQP